MSMLEHFQTQQQVLFDLTANYLEPLNTAYGRLAYLYGLYDQPSGKYAHADLARLYGPEPVNLVVGQCHEEVFERLLEMPLNAQGEELRKYLAGVSGVFGRNGAECRKTCEKWAPFRAPSYLKELYNSNLGVLLELLQDDASTDRPNK